MTGGKIQRKTIQYAKSIGVMVKRSYAGPGAETGWPDVEFFFPQGRVLFIEFKSPGETTKKRQLHIHSELRKLGHTVKVCDNFDDAKLAIDSFGQRLGIWL